MATRAIAVLEGDQTGQELLEEALRVLQPGVIGFPLEFERFDLRLENRRLKIDREILSKAAAWFARETEPKPKGSSNS